MTSTTERDTAGEGAVDPLRRIGRLAVLARGADAVRVLAALGEAGRETDPSAGGGDQAATLLVYPGPDGDWYAREADAALALGPEHYRGTPDGRRRAHLLDPAAVVATLQAAGVDAVWPGSGVVGDLAALAQACEDAGVTVIGPSAACLRVVADRVALRHAAEDCGVPVLAWSGPHTDLADVEAAAATVGYPVVLLDAGQTGRRGVHRAADPQSLREVYRRATSAAQAAGAGCALVVEHDPGPVRRLSVEIVADAAGTVWALDVRDVSVRQRGRRVLLESSFGSDGDPADATASELEERIRAAATALATALGFRDAGSVQVALLDGGRFAVTGVEAGLQVDHALTEEVTGLDLVALRLELARGARLPAERPRLHGHAVQARLHAGNVESGAGPAPGRVALVVLPGGTGVRVDTGVREGDDLGADLEPVLATVTAWGRDRHEAIARLRRALRRTVIALDGCPVDRGFVLDLLDRPQLRERTADDGWLDRLVASGGHVPAADPLPLVMAGVEAYDADQVLADAAFHARAARGRPVQPEPVGARIQLTYRGVAYRLRVDHTGPDTYRVHVAGAGTANEPGIDVRIERVSAYERRLFCAGRRHEVVVVQDGPSYRIEVDSAAHVVTRDDGVLVRAASPAFVVSLAVTVGDRVAVGDPVAVLESMKMESSVSSPVAGVVTSVEVVANAQVDAGAPLLRVRPDHPEDSDGSAAGPGEVDGPRPDFTVLTATTPAAGPLCAPVHAALHAYLLGYDLDPATLKSVLGQRQRLAESLPAADPDLLTCEDRLIDLYADLGALYRPRTEGGVDAELAAGTGTQEYLNAYLQWLDPDRAGVPTAYRARLERALARYGITGLRRTPALERAVVQLFTSLGRVRDLTPVVAAILQRRLLHRDVLAPLADAGLRERLERLAGAAQGRQQVVADLARDVRFHFLDEPVLDGVVASVYAEMDEHLAALRADPDRPDREQRVERLVWCPQPMRGRLLRAWLAQENHGLRNAVLEIYARRFYRVRVLGALGFAEHEGHQLGFTEYDLSGLPVHLVVAYAPLASLPELSRAVAAHLADVPADREVVLDVATWRTGERPEMEQTADEVADLLAVCTFGRPMHRISVTVTSAGGPAQEHFRTQHLTYRSAPGSTGSRGGFVEDLLYRNLHPMLAKRLDLWRLSNFALDRRPSPEDIYLFLGVAHENPKDRRLFALAEVRDLTAVTDPVTGRVTYPQLERMGLEALAAMRDSLALLPDRDRPVANRLVLYVRPAWEVPQDSWRRLARAFAPLAAGAGLEKVVLRVRLPRPEGGLREAVLHVEGIGQGGGAVTVREEPAGGEPIRPLTEYRQKVLLAQRFGAPYPYEIVRLLTPERGTSGSFAAGTFVEHDLDGDGALVPVDREPGRNSAHLVVGLLTTYTPVVPEGISRVTLLSDPTKGLGNLAEPECRRINAALDLAERLRLPVDWFAVSSGALIAMDSGTENMDWISATLRRIIEFTQGGGEINVVVTGINVGGQPYWNAEATMLMHTKGILVMTPASAMVLTGKQALDFSGGVSAEDNFGIGGYDRVMGPNGQAQYWAPSFEGACQVLMRHHEHTFVVPGERFPRRRPTTDPVDRDVRPSPHTAVPGSDFTVVGDVFDDVANPERKKPFDIRSVMRSVTDVDSEPLERWQRWRGADTSVVWDARVGGIAVCMLGLESRTTPRRGFVPADGPLAYTAGTLFPQSSRKTARAVNAASGNRPLVVLANLSGFDGSPESMRRWQLEYGAEIGRAVTNFRGPIVFVVVSRYHGGAFVVFSKALNPGMEIAAVEGSFASVIGGAPAAATVFAREVKQRTEKDGRLVALREQLAAASGAEAGALRARLQETTTAVRSEKLGEVADEFDAIHTIDRALRVGSVDRIIAARDLRPYVVEALERGMARTRARE